MVDRMDFPSLVNTFLDNYGEYERRIGRPFSIQSPSSLYRSYFRGDPPTDEAEATAFGHFKQFEVLAGLGLQYAGTHPGGFYGCCIACGFETDYPSLIDDKLTLQHLLMHAGECAPVRVQGKGKEACPFLLAQIHLHMHYNGIKDTGELFLAAQLQHTGGLFPRVEIHPKVFISAASRSNMDAIRHAEDNERRYRVQTELAKYTI